MFIQHLIFFIQIIIIHTNIHFLIFNFSFDMYLYFIICWELVVVIFITLALICWPDKGCHTPPPSVRCVFGNTIKTKVKYRLEQEKRNSCSTRVSFGPSAHPVLSPLLVGRSKCRSFGVTLSSGTTFIITRTTWCHTTR